MGNKAVSAMTSAQNPHGGQEALFFRFILPCIIGERLWLLLDIQIRFSSEQAAIRMEQA